MLRAVNFQSLGTAFSGVRLMSGKQFFIFKFLAPALPASVMSISHIGENAKFSPMLFYAQPFSKFKPF